MHKDGGVLDGLNLDLLTECKSQRTEVTNGASMFYLTGFFLSLLHQWDACHDAWLRTVLWTFAAMASLDYMVCKSQNWKPAVFLFFCFFIELSISQQKHLWDRSCIYPFYSRVLTPVFPINTMHLSLTHRDIKAVLHESRSRIYPNPTSVLYHTHTHTLQKAQVPFAS